MPVISVRTRLFAGALAMGLAILGLGGACRSLGLAGSSPADADSGTVLWAGGVTDSSARVVARPATPEGEVRLAVDTTGTWADPMIFEGTVPATNSDVRHFHLDDLAPRTTYHYALHRGGAIDTTEQGQFQTFGTGAFSFRVALGACAETGSQHPVFGALWRTQPDLFLHLGDLHYEDIRVPAPTAFRTAYRRVHASSPQARLFRSMALAYMWDDHDYGPNNSSRQAPGQNASRQAYREYVPHYPLAPKEQRRPIYQAFTVGRVRIILTDLRSARTPNQAPDSTKTMMGTAQKAWFKRQLAQAKDQYPVIAWGSSVPWIGAPGDSNDHWGGFAAERRELATYIDSLGVADQLVTLSGDAHMVALDDGTHNRYGQEDGGGFPVVQVASLGRRGSVKGGPYTHGPYPTPIRLFGQNDGQFVLMDVQDDGGEEVCITWTGKRYQADTERLVTLLDWRRCFPAP
ncbi:alkaline phosphatase D family protein [Salinibacter altiplanensis]|uniref:alkaline phosphatase D family protein n=1 Tax=Salinibacter altiplanensis TaxID=1803181 RepID=UPI001E464AFC|nr:alkaline phosphatase D family protein [Salinibacter altiplanensis]